MAELSRDTLTDPAAMTRMVSVLLKGRMVSQKAHPTDKRRWELALAPRGEKLTSEVEKIYLALSVGALQILSESEKAQFSRILQKLIQHVSRKKTSPAQAGHQTEVNP